MFELRQAAVTDSIKLDKMARDIHGVLTDQSGNPVAGVTITVAGDNDPNQPYATVITDSRGAYRIDNPMVGGAAIMVRCPQSSGRPNGILAVTAAEVKPATDLTGRDYLAPSDCASPVTITALPTDDLDALIRGYASLSQLDPASIVGVG